MKAESTICKQIHINQPGSVLARTTRRCTTCKRVRRFIVRFYEWYASRWTCGGCGYLFVSGHGRANTGAKARDNNRRWVRNEWPGLLSISITFAETATAFAKTKESEK